MGFCACGARPAARTPLWHSPVNVEASAPHGGPPAWRKRPPISSITSSPTCPSVNGCCRFPFPCGIFSPLILRGKWGRPLGPAHEVRWGSLRSAWSLAVLRSWAHSAQCYCLSLHCYRVGAVVSTNYIAAGRNGDFVYLLEHHGGYVSVTSS